MAATPGFDADPCYRWAHLSRTLAWTDAAIFDSTHPEGTSWLPDLGWLVDRRRVNGTHVVFAAKAGHNAEPHNHNDLGHFILYAGGEQLLADLGAGEYRAGYFGPERYTAFLYPSAQAHSVPTVNGAPQAEGPTATAAVLHQHTDTSGSQLSLDLSTAYPPAVGVRRTFHWRNNATLTLTDAFGGADEVEELFISRVTPVCRPGTATWTGRSAAVSLHYAPDAWHPTVDRLDTIAHGGEPDTVFRLRLRSLHSPTTSADFRFAVNQCPRRPPPGPPPA
ncbi:heparinase II/III family protein [Streptomyces sp. NBC_01718]|uniref:heparinase II/III domain-containing protein n=1 Tax=Streptomyces sp. NBC_01718 TaxID=2975919 RepID=UPI00352DD651